MPKRYRHYLKAAQSIHRQLMRAAAGLVVPDLPRQLWQHVRVTANSVAKAQVWGWQQAARVKSRELLNGLDELQRAVNQLIGELQDRLQPLPVATAAELYADLVALEQERFEVQIDLDQHQLRVTTEPIELERIHLGRFEIRLDWQPPHATRRYRIVALEPNPSAANDAVTHPHINDEILCEGDGRASIARRWRPGGSTTSLRSSIVCCTRTRRVAPMWSSTSGTGSPATIAVAWSTRRKTTPAVAVRRRSVRIARAVARTAICPVVPGAVIPADCVTSRPVVLVWTLSGMQKPGVSPLPNQ